jgi:DNA-binding beta-propeller fold protein YncE
MKLLLFFSLVGAVLLALISPLEAAALLTPGVPVALTGTQGRFDFIKVDPTRHRLLACHTGNGTLDVIDLATTKVIWIAPTGAAQGVAIDDRHGRYFVSASKPPRMVILDANQLEVTGVVPLPDPADLVAYHPASDRVFVCNDEKPELWVIDPAAKKLLTTILLPGSGMEDLGFDGPGTYLFQNLKMTSKLAQLDPLNDKIVATWPTAPAVHPHGLAMVTGTDSVLVAGGTGRLVLMSLKTGQVLASAAIAPRVDEITYDPGLQRVYCASGGGVLSVVGVENNQLTLLATIPSAPGAHSVAVDPQTHTVWIVFAKGTQPYVQAFTVN